MTKPRRYRRLTDIESFGYLTTMRAMQASGSIDRKLTDPERMFLAVSATSPTHMLTIHGPDDGRDMAYVWTLLKKRINNARTNPRPFIYFGTRAKGLGSGGDHLHLLLWDMLYAPTLVKHTKELRLGKPTIKKITYVADDPIANAIPVAYTLGQQSSIFATKYHLRHRRRSKYQRAWFYPQDSTLRDNLPELLSAIQEAHSPSTSDAVLISRFLTLLIDIQQGDQDSQPCPEPR